MTPGTQGCGQAAEATALAFLRQQGLQLLVQNWRCRLGELDLVMLDQDTLVFVEVRYRRHQGWGGALASVTPHKQQKLIRAAQAFLQQQPRWANYPCRFDVVAFDAKRQCCASNWIRNAFES